VIAAVAAGTLDRGHYESFINLTREAKLGTLSAGEQRKAARGAKAGKRDR
jgi:hypothetical protein